jgi:hypothetical protein
MFNRTHTVRALLLQHTVRGMTRTEWRWTTTPDFQDPQPESRPESQSIMKSLPIGKQKDPKIYNVNYEV